MNKHFEQYNYLLGDRPCVGDFAIFAEQFQFLNTAVSSIQDLANKNPDAKRVSRITGQTDFKIGGIDGKRSMFSFVQWKVQRVLDALHNLKGTEVDDTKTWLKTISDALIDMKIEHRLKREGHREVLEK